ncbi:MAG: ribbon-helix-helix protein, CopG family [Gemmatimonadota bacterium]|nr:ribbon-helix-helix protein, CopG family [Gemmatimonadota bacterium]
MSANGHYARIAITLPAADLAAADRMAKQQDRSRSWIVAEAVRRYAAEVDDERASQDLGDSRRAQLHRDLALTADQRVRQAEDTSRTASAAEKPQRFASFDEYVAWQRASGASP